jgi:hypothetical protein
MQSPELVALNGAVASPAHGDIRDRHTQLVGRSLNMDEALENITAITESGRIDVSSTVEWLSDYNLSLLRYADDAGVRVIRTRQALKQ